MTDGNGDASQLFTLADANPGVYAVQFDLRQGGAPGCPTTSCDVDYSTGDTFAAGLARFAVPGAVAFWSGDDDDENDELGDAQVVWTGTEAYRAGHFRHGFDLTGGAYLGVPNPAAKNLTPGQKFSVSAWVYRDTASLGASIVNLRTAANTSGYTLEVTVDTPGKLQFVVNTGGTLAEWHTVDAIGFPIGQLFHVAATYDAGTQTARLYRDGALVGVNASVPGSAVFLAGSEQLELGRHVPVGYALDGLLDEVLYFDDALEPEEVSGLADLLFADGLESGGTTAWDVTVGG